MSFFVAEMLLTAVSSFLPVTLGMFTVAASVSVSVSVMDAAGLLIVLISCLKHRR